MKTEHAGRSIAVTETKSTRSARVLWAEVCIVVAVVLAVTTRAAAQSYAITDLGTLGGSYSRPYAINDLGQVVGYSVLPNEFTVKAFFWQDGEMFNLGTLGGTHSYAYALNNQGQVVGSSFIADAGVVHSFLWQDGEMIDLGTPLWTYSEADDINDAGQIAGTMNLMAFLWEDGVWTDLGTLPGFTISFGHGINEAGEVVGGAGSCFFCPGRAVLWTDGTIVDLGVLPGYEGSGAAALNDAGDVVGSSSNVIPSVLRATLWTGGRIVDLGAGTGSQSIAWGINNAAQVVGYFGNGSLFINHYAFIWEGGVMTDLNDLIPPDSGWVLHEANDIDEVGQIVGAGINPDGFGRGFMLTPCDFSDGPGEDCDANGVPDECQIDCHCNGVPDVCDIADGFSNDCDGDNVPDECDPGPTITQQPASQEVEEGQFAFFQVAADGVLLEYQWRKDGVELINSEHIIGAQSFLLVILDVQSADAGQYDCVVAEPAGPSCTTSNPATLTVIAVCPADLTDDGAVSAADLAELLAAWGANPDHPADFNHDDQVDASDLAELLSAWGLCE